MVSASSSRMHLFSIVAAISLTAVALRAQAPAARAPLAEDVAHAIHHRATDAEDSPDEVLA